MRRHLATCAACSELAEASIVEVRRGSLAFVTPAQPCQNGTIFIVILEARRADRIHYGFLCCHALLRQGISSKSLKLFSRKIIFLVDNF